MSKNSMKNQKQQLYRLVIQMLLLLEELTFSTAASSAQVLL